MIPKTLPLLPLPCISRSIGFLREGQIYGLQRLEYMVFLSDPPCTAQTGADGLIQFSLLHILIVTPAIFVWLRAGELKRITR